jgi:hypothetical protein
MKGAPGKIRFDLLKLFLLGCAALVFCAAPRVKDHIFDVAGTVSAEDGTPLYDVEVILNVDPPIYEGVEEVNTQRVVTSKGAFIFRCLSHSASTKYTVTVRKEGYEAQGISGTAPPSGSYTIRLKKRRPDKGSNVR